MTKRIVLALVAFTAAVVLGAMIPLGVNTTGYYRSSFTALTEERAKTFAAIAQPTARSPSSESPGVGDILSQAQQLGDGLIVYAMVNGTSALETLANDGLGPNPQGIVEAGMLQQLADAWAPLVAQAEQEKQPANSASPTILQAGNWQVAIMPVYSASNYSASNAPSPRTMVGTVVLARSTVKLETQIRTLWYILGAIALAALALAAVLAMALAQWVSRPLADLDTTARRLADGNLAVRAPTDAGPPELRRLSRTFNTMTGRLEALVHGSRAMLADVSHQLRTPLAALRLRLDLLAADVAETDPEQAAELAGALDETARLSRLVDGLLAVSRAENVTPQPKSIDLTEVGDERVVAWLPVAEDRGIDLIAPSMADQGAEEPVLGWLGEGHLEQILDNLIANALDACDTGNHITVSATRTAQGARVRVTDDGPGMTEEERSRAFMRFTSNSTGAGGGIGGTGIGLAIVHRLVTSNGGTATLEPTPGGGLTVAVTFPAAPELAAVGNTKATR
jgi:signal transduction histidine kinase